MLEHFFQALREIFNTKQPLEMLLNDMYNITASAWNYKIFVTAESQSIYVSNVVIGVILFLLGTKLVRFISRNLKIKLSKRIKEVGVVDSLSQLIYYLLTVLMIIFVLDISNVPLTVFTVVGTTLALGIGLGSQNIVNNFISGILIMIERPIKVGDTVEVKNITGVVVNIGARCTTIRTSNNIDILVPNSNILQDVVVNWTNEDTILKTHFNLYIKASVEFKKVEEIVLGVLESSDKVLRDPIPMVYLNDFNSEYYAIEIDFSLDLSKGVSKKIILDEINRIFIEEFKLNKIIVLSRTFGCCNSSKSKGS